MLSLLLPALMLLGSVPLVLALVRANELFFLRVRAGRARRVRGRIPPRLLQDINEVLGAGTLDEGALRGVSEGGQLRLYVDGELPEGHRQRLRNVAAQWPVVRVRNAPRR